MIRKISIFVMLALFCSTCAFAVTMPSRAGRWDTGVSLAGTLPTDSDTSNTGYYGANVSYGISDQLALGMSIGWQDALVKFRNQNGDRVEAGKLAHMPIFADIIYRHFNEKSSLTPYGVLGLGALVSHSHGTGVLNDFNLESKSVDSFAMKFGVGLDWAVTDQWLLYFEADYIFAASDVTVNDKSTGGAVDSSDLDYWLIGGGIKSVF